MRVYGHNSVPHNEEANKLAKLGAQKLVIHKMYGIIGLWRDNKGAAGAKWARSQEASGSASDRLQHQHRGQCADRQKHQQQWPLELLDLPPDQCK